MKRSTNGTTLIPLKDLVIGKNVRQPSNEGLADLVASIKANGILQPLLVRPKGKHYELVCGHRRHAAARQAGLTELPVFSREMSDAEALAAQIVENVQRENAHPLDEAQAYRQLMTRAKLDVAGIAARVGRSVPYIYDRMRLTGLVPEAQKLFRAERITPGHAVTLARLQPADQKRAIDARPGEGGLFEHEHLLWSPEDDGRPNTLGQETLKVRTVRELQGWIDTHVKFDPSAEDLPDLFPDTAVTLNVAKEKAEKIVPITYDYTIHPDARDGQRVFGPRSWKRADGRRKSKTCDCSAIGVIVVGPGRGETLKVCIHKACKIHFGEEIRAAKKRSAASSKAAATRSVRDQKRRQEEYAREEAQHARFNKAIPAIVEALAVAIAKVKSPAKGALAELLVKYLSSSQNKKFASAMKRGKTAEDLLRYCGFMAIVDTLGHFDAERAFPKLVKPLGIDVAKIVEKVAPAKPTAKDGKPESVPDDAPPDAGDEGIEEGDEE